MYKSTSTAMGQVSAAAVLTDRQQQVLKFIRDCIAGIAKRRCFCSD